MFLRCYLVPLSLAERNCFPIWSIVLSLPSSVEMRTLTSHSMQGTNQLSQCLKMLDRLFWHASTKPSNTIGSKKTCCKQNLILLMKEILHPALVGRVNIYIYICKIMNMSHYVHGSFRARCFAGFLPSTVVSHTKLPHYNSFTGLSLLRNCWLCAGEIFASAKGKLKGFHFILPSNFRIYTPEGPWRLRWNIIMEVLEFWKIMEVLNFCRWTFRRSSFRVVFQKPWNHFPKAEVTIREGWAGGKGSTGGSP